MSLPLIEILRAKEVKMRQKLAEAQNARQAHALTLPLHHRIRILLFLSSLVLSVFGILAWPLDLSTILFALAGLGFIGYAILRFNR